MADAQPPAARVVPPVEIEPDDHEERIAPPPTDAAECNADTECPDRKVCRGQNYCLPREAGPVLGEEAQRIVATAFEGWAQAWWDDNSGDTLARVAVDALTAHVDVLVRAAEQRGAKRERARIATDLARAQVWADPTGQWTAEQAEAASRQKAYMTYRVADGSPVTAPEPPMASLGGHPLTDPGDGRQECETCGKWVWLVIHSCKGVPVTEAAMQRWKERHGA